MTTEVKIVRSSQIAACPIHSLEPRHYRRGTCACHLTRVVLRTTVRAVVTEAWTLDVPDDRAADEAWIWEEFSSPKDPGNPAIYIVDVKDEDVCGEKEDRDFMEIETLEAKP